MAKSSATLKPSSKTTLVLDWDNTLAFSLSVEELGGYQSEQIKETVVATLDMDRNGFRGETLLLFRPGLQDFLATVNSKYDLVLWSHGVSPYIDQCLKVQNIRQHFKGVINRDTNPLGIKDLAALRVDMTSVAIVDDNNQTFGVLNPFNCIDIVAWDGIDMNDRYLEIMPELIAFKFSLLKEKQHEELLNLRNRIIIQLRDLQQTNEAKRNLM